MAAKKTSSAMNFILESLKKDPQAKYGDIAAAAAKKKLKIYAVMFGRAQTLLGIVQQAPRGQGKMAKARARARAKAAGGAQKRGPGRPRKNPVVGFDGTLEGIVTAVKSSEQAKARYRAALERIQSILSGVIG